MQFATDNIAEDIMKMNWKDSMVFSLTKPELFN